MQLHRPPGCTHPHRRLTAGVQQPNPTHPLQRCLGGDTGSVTQPLPRTPGELPAEMPHAVTELSVPQRRGFGTPGGSAWGREKRAARDGHAVRPWLTPRSRVCPAALRSPEAGGELPRGLQARIAGGGDFVLRADLPARQGAGWKMRTVIRKQKRRGARGDPRPGDTHLSLSCGSSRYVQACPSATSSSSRSGARLRAGRPIGPPLPCAPRRLCPPRPATGLRREPLLPPRRRAAPRGRQMCPRGGAAPAQMCRQMRPRGGAGPRQMCGGGRGTPRTQRVFFAAPRLQGARGKGWGGQKVMEKGKVRNPGGDERPSVHHH